METPFSTKAERDAYAAAHKFDLRGDGLSDEQISEQEQTFLNKVFAAGYMLHSYKDRSKPWAPYAMDNSIGEEGQRNGGTGKSLFFTALEELIKTVTISGKEPKIFENDHTFEEVKPQTKMVVIDDCAKNLDVEKFYDRQTGKFRVNPKGNHIFTLSYTSRLRWLLRRTTFQRPSMRPMCAVCSSWCFLITTTRRQKTTTILKPVK